MFLLTFYLLLDLVSCHGQDELDPFADDDFDTKTNRDDTVRKKSLLHWCHQFKIFYISDKLYFNMTAVSPDGPQYYVNMYISFITLTK